MGLKAKLAFLASASLFLALDFFGFVLMLSGVAAMQSGCSGSAANLFLGGGSSGYLAHVSCSRFFAYPWFITFFDMFTWVLVVVFLAVGLHLWRPGLIALLAISTALCLETANSFLYFNDVESASNQFDDRARVTVAGAIIKAVGNVFLIGILGYWDESAPAWKEEPPKKAKAKKGVTGPEPTPTTVAGVRRGRIEEGGRREGPMPIAHHVGEPAGPQQQVRSTVTGYHEGRLGEESRGVGEQRV